MNKGIDLSIGAWLYFLGAGDLLKRDTVFENIFKDEIETNTHLLLGNVEYDSYDLKKRVFYSKWSRLLWLKNTVHHQSIIYKKEVFEHQKYDTSLQVLGDYDLNLFLFKNDTKVKKYHTIIANCELNGISKTYNASLYKEESVLKVKNSHLIFKPFFYFLSVLKFFLKNTHFQKKS